MKRNILSILGLVLLLNLSTLNVNCAEIVYPKSNNVTIDSPRTFFIGSENPDNKLTINGESVEIHPSGGFWHTVNLSVGENIFKIDNGKESKTYIITRNNSNSNPNKTQLTEKKYNKPITIVTNENNIPLRSTPVDFGINRLQHLQKGILFRAIGEYGDFYKVQLARDDYAWITKSSMKELQNIDLKPVKIDSFTYEETPDKRIFKLKLSQKTPYVLYDNNGLDLTVYNVDSCPFNKYEIHINPIVKLFGFNSYYKSDNELVIEVNNAPVINKNCPLKDIKITLDAGHGGSEYGAISPLGNKEKDINLAIAKKLQTKLQEAGAIVYMTRDDDSEVSLSDRVKKSNDNNSQIFLSIHNNALPDSLADRKATGTETYYFYPQSRELAKTLLNTITTDLELKNNGAKQQSFAVIRNTNSLAVLLELGYIINPEDNAKLIDECFQDKAAESIKHGLENYLNGIQ